MIFNWFLVYLILLMHVFHGWWLCVCFLVFWCLGFMMAKKVGWFLVWICVFIWFRVMCDVGFFSSFVVCFFVEIVELSDDDSVFFVRLWMCNDVHCFCGKWRNLVMGRCFIVFLFCRQMGGLGFGESAYLFWFWICDVVHDDFIWCVHITFKVKEFGGVAFVL